MQNNSLSWYTLLGLFVVIILAPAILLLFSVNAPSPLTDGFVVARELTMFALAGFLFFVVTRGERLGLDSIGLQTGSWGRALLWGVIGLILCIVVAIICIQIMQRFGITDPGTVKSFKALSKATLILIVTRAAVVEEIFFRGFMMQRFKGVSGNPWFYVVLPAIIFGLLHYQLGLRGVVIAFALGLTLSFIYIKSGDLKAAVISHFLVDFMSIIVFPPQA